ncbi:efflux RND transporter periplasmic adaptor subunit [Desulfovibrio ferrophilus]|uniref:Efflux transporter, RND family, MFP subunit n=1 Tax=Desulfovibrio ferrophilus TaxID=241368 RepID=A0A2Z6AZX4_9BACT|nr:efflux RND transporter periplasmic adaptor subunit [Desulfovibrio ferrophilus]BBD08768.1 efflux transporter, RND family, MFP subunit [Desulfovibrio ferrophilus]
MKMSRRMLVLPVLLLGILTLIVLVKTRLTPERVGIVERARAVRVVPATELALVPRAVGYGSVQPGQVWEAVAEVSGKVVEVHESLDRGAILPAGAVLMRIDPVEYRLARDRSEAAVAVVLAKLRELDQRERNAMSSLGVEQNSLQLSERELERKRSLQESGTISKSEMETEEKRYLTQKNIVQGYQSTLELVPSERQALSADLASARSSLENARLDLDKTVLRTPFECRIAAVNVELSQYAKSGQVVVVADSIGISEIPAQVPIAAFRNLLDMKSSPLAAGRIDMDAVRQAVGLKAVVRLNVAGTPVEWQARFSRISDEIDPQTRTVGVYVVVDNPYLQAIPGGRPPLVKNMYCEVELRGQPRAARVIVPRSALREGRVHVAGPDDRLLSREVVVDYLQGNVASIASGLQAGERVIVSDVSPAIEGMMLSVEQDTALFERVVAEATGEAGLR